MTGPYQRDTRVKTIGAYNGDSPVRNWGGSALEYHEFPRPGKISIARRRSASQRTSFRSVE